MDQESRQRFAEIVKNLRGERDLRQFARTLGVSHPTVIAWENCQSEPKRQNLERIAELRGESLEVLLEYIDGKQQVSGQDRLLSAIRGASKEQLAVLVRAIADRLEAL
ncbi:helix-turn-helix transcriptional regulator [Anabaena azotica FACHB-119]|uniref:Helix-turn-helix transcriptional regulator n=1 Tax=Anabaena azotica FACHB-119 TaxID=947527 RepID=A0ABR8CY30_9NOST|nr:helix-turn-helix transcriptional regulator [Anabaena azotica FACHB-119]